MTSAANNNNNAGDYVLPPLPWPENALEPAGISAETIQYHYGKHHAGYVRKLNVLVADGVVEAGTPLVVLIKKTDNQKVFNLAAQIWNHSFYWESMVPKGGKCDLNSNVGQAIASQFENGEGFSAAFAKRAGCLFGSGWVWLSVNGEGNLVITDGNNAFNPLKDGLIPILVIDVWEHAYYIDRKNNRGAYIQSFMSLINWAKVDERYNAAKKGCCGSAGCKCAGSGCGGCGSKK